MELNIQRGEASHFIRMPNLGADVEVICLGQNLLAYDRAGGYVSINAMGQPRYGRFPGPPQGEKPIRYAAGLVFSLTSGLTIHNVRTENGDVSRLNQWTLSSGQSTRPAMYALRTNARSFCSVDTSDASNKRGRSDAQGSRRPKAAPSQWLDISYRTFDIIW